MTDSFECPRCGFNFRGIERVDGYVVCKRCFTHIEYSRFIGLGGLFKVRETPTPGAKFLKSVVVSCVREFGIGNDNRVAFCYGTRETNSADFFIAIPPSAFYMADELISPSFRYRLNDFHTGNMDGSACLSGNEFVSKNIEAMNSRLSIGRGTMDQFLHARRLSYIASSKGWSWTGTDADIPPSWRNIEEEFE